MLSLTVPLLLAACSAIAGAQSAGNGPSPYPPFSGDPFKKYTLTADGINASFIPYGARITNLLVKDKDGCFQDVVLGYDDGKQYLTDTETNHTYFGPVVGRYANRIKNGTFTIDGQTSHIPTNEHGGANTLHGGYVGYDQQNWTVASYTKSSITFTFYDHAQSGFPGDLLNVATYTLTGETHADGPEFVSRLVSIPLNEATPIMLSNHIYWNLGAFVSPDAKTILNNTLYMPLADRIIATDGILVPNGNINLTTGTVFDFAKGKGKQIGQDLLQTTGACGTGCVGYDNAFILDRGVYAGGKDPSVEVLRLSSPDTGIEMSLATDQQGLQIYSCGGQNGTIPVKASQQRIQGSTTHVEKYGCLVIEAQDWIDEINQQQWGRNPFQVYSPTTEPYVNFQTYTFGIVDKK